MPVGRCFACDNACSKQSQIKPRTDEQVFPDKFSLTSFICSCVLYVHNSCGLAKVVKKKYCQISRTQEQIKPVKDNLSRKTCSSFRRVSELVKKLVKENLLACTGLKQR